MKKILFALSLAACLISCGGKDSGFAIVIDSESYNQARTEIDAYQALVKSRGLNPILVIDRWGVPDSIRAELIRLHNSKSSPIEGCVFIGDIPVARVRDAQFMTSAFKMDQDGRHPMSDYCISTDRFYDSFDLDWDFIQQDTANSAWFYYSLRPDCPQDLHPTIYSARICPRTNERGDKYEKLRRYMQRVNNADVEYNPLDKVLSFGGHGNVSDSWIARMDERIEIYEMMPWLKNAPMALSFMDFRDEPVIKPYLMDVLQDPRLDYALLHHHGSETVQYLSGTPVTASLPLSIDNARRYARSQARKNVDRGMSEKESKASIERFLGSPIPQEWMSEAFDTDIIADDDAMAYSEDIHVEEFSYFHPQARMVSLDACYNGSFQEEESIQEAYLFGEGNRTLIAIANSVNSIQDRWINRHMGLVGMGMRVGYVASMTAILETHVFGDPTFSFPSTADCGFDINEAVLNTDSGFWKRQLDNEYPAVQALAAYMLAEKCSGNWSYVLLDKFMESPYGTVRLAVMMELAEYDDANFEKCISAGLTDSHEMTQRFAVNYAGAKGSPELIANLVRLYCEPQLSNRVEFDLDAAFRSLDSVSVITAFDKDKDLFDFYLNGDSVMDARRKELLRSVRMMTDGFEEDVLQNGRSERSRISDIRSLRNYTAHHLVPALIDYLSEPREVEVQKAMVEALGWFEMSYRAPEIAAMAEKLKDDTRFDESIRKEALRTYNRTRK